MPLYNFTVITKVTESQILSNIIKGVCLFCFNGTGVVRMVKNRGERISARAYFDSNKQCHYFVRYIDFYLDLDPISMKKLQDLSKQNSDVLHIWTHKMKNDDYFKEILDREYFRKYETFEIDEKTKENFYRKSVSTQISKKIVDEFINNSQSSDLKFDLKTSLNDLKDIEDKLNDGQKL